jgi:cytoplasmic iron level regulating protein YaaA (DUF328/UPF0246 family)
MKIILSPAKRLNENDHKGVREYSIPEFLNNSEELVEILRKYSKKEISGLMKLSDSLSELNYHRFQVWDKKNIGTLGQPSVFLFEGDAYRGLDIKSFNNEQLENLNQSLRILSGLYGILKPMDLILPYRLEMGTALKNEKGKNLYEFWKEELTTEFNKELKGEILVNLASKEYSSAIDFSKLDSPVVQVDFLQEKDGKFKNIAIHSKRARGLMTAFIAKNNIQEYENLKAFDSEDYYFNSSLSKENHLVFCR